MPKFQKKVKETHVSEDNFDNLDAPVTELDVTVAAPIKAVKHRAPLADRLATMNVAEKAVYYGKRARILETELSQLKELCGAEAVDLASRY